MAPLINETAQAVAQALPGPAEKLLLRWLLESIEGSAQCGRCADLESSEQALKDAKEWAQELSLRYDQLLRRSSDADAAIERAKALEHERDVLRQELEETRRHADTVRLDRDHYIQLSKGLERQMEALKARLEGMQAVYRFEVDAGYAASVAVGVPGQSPDNGLSVGVAEPSVAHEKPAPKPKTEKKPEAEPKPKPPAKRYGRGLGPWDVPYSPDDAVAVLRLSVDGCSVEQITRELGIPREHVVAAKEMVSNRVAALRATPPLGREETYARLLTRWRDRLAATPRRSVVFTKEELA